MHDDATSTQELHDWLDFTILDSHGNPRAHGPETKPILEEVAGVTFGEDQFHRLILVIADFVAALCMETPKKSEVPTFSNRLSRLRRSVKSIEEIFDVTDAPTAGFVESLRMNMRLFREQGVGIEEFREAVHTASKDLAHLEDGLEQMFSSKPGRRNRQKFPPFLQFCSQIREIWLEAGGSEHASGYYLDDKKLQKTEWKGDLGHLILAILGGYSTPTGKPIFLVSPSTVRGALQKVKSELGQ